MRLGFAIAAFLQADVLLLDEVFAVGDENFQRKCFGVIAAFKNRGGTILFVSHDAQAVERLCERSILLSARREGLRRADARGDRPLPAPARRRPRSGRARRRAARVGHAARPRSPARACSTRTAASGSSSSPASRSRLEVDLRAHHGDRRRPGSTSSCATRRAFSSPRTAVDTATLGWPAGPGQLTATLDVERPSLAFGRFRVRLGLVGDGRPHAAPVRRRARVSRLPGRGGTRPRPARRNVAGRGESGDPMSYKTCPEWPELMELAPDLQFKHISVADAQLPFDVLSKISHVSLGEVEMCCRPRAPRLQRRPHGPSGRGGARRHALVRGARVGDVGARRLEPRCLTGRRCQAARSQARRLSTVATVVVPFRSGGKSRLPAERPRRGRARDARRRARGGGRRTPSRRAPRHRRRRGRRASRPALGVEVVADPGGGQGAAVEAALAGRRGRLPRRQRRPAARAAVRPRGARAPRRARRRALVAAADGTTNALALPDRDVFAPLYGAGQRRPLRAHARPRSRVHDSIPELEHDVDTLADLERDRLRVGRARTCVDQHKLLGAHR